MVAKEYKFSTVYRVGLLVATLIAFYGTFEMGRSYGLVASFLGLACIIWFIVYTVKFKIVITDEYIVVDIGKLGKRFERNWNQIYRVSRIPFAFFWMYKVHCNDKPTLTFTNSIANYKDLLREIVERAPNAEVDESIRKLLEGK